MTAEDRTKLPEYVTVIVEKSDFDSVEERIRAAGCDRYVANPISYREFLATVAVQLTQS